MILYTIMPEQLVYPADYSQCESTKSCKYKWCRINGF